MSRKKTTLLAGAIVFSLGTAAFAAPAVNTLLNEGYDDENQVLVIGVSDIDQEDAEIASLDCALDGTYQYVLAEDDETTDTTESVVEDEDGGKKGVSITEVAELTEDGETVTFVDEDDETTDEPVEYGTEDAVECSLSAIDVTGPNGQVNHGTITSSFVAALREMGIKGAGCLVRTIAGSDYGKGDQQVTVGDVEEAVEEVVDVVEEGEEATAEVDLASHEAACAAKDKGRPEGTGRPEGAGKPEGAGRPETAGSQSKKNG